MSDHNFEQDRSYTDMNDGQTKMFTIRDYSKKTKVAVTNTSTKESKTEAQKAYDDSTWEVVNEIIDQNPAVFGRESYKAVDVINSKIEWNPEGLFWMVRDPQAYTIGSDFSNLKAELIRSILDHEGYSNQTPITWESIIDTFRTNFQKYQTL